MKKINRILICNATGKEITVKPDKYARLLEYYGSEENLKKRFVSYSVEKEARSPSFSFWFEHSLELKDFRKTICKILTKFNYSNRCHSDVVTLQNEADFLCTEHKISMNNIEFIQSTDEHGGCVVGVKIKNIPFINEYIITLT